MKRRLLLGTVGIAITCVLILGVPLVLLARHEVWSSAQERVQQQAEDVAVSLEDKIEHDEPLALHRYEASLPDRSITVSTTGGRTVDSVGSTPSQPIVGHAEVLDHTVLIQAPSTPVRVRAWEVTILLGGLSVIAIAASVALALRQSRRLATPVAQLLARADDLGHGDFSARPIVSGIPEVDALSETLERSARQIGTLVQIQGDFAADAAHQLRTPLTSVALHLDAISAVGDVEVQVESDLALAQVERLNDVITHFLQRARGDTAEPEALDLSKLIGENCAVWERLLSRSGRRLHKDMHTSVFVQARPEHLVGVVNSLLDNALVHGAGDVLVTVTKRDASALISVTDQGDGVADDLAPTIFERRISGKSSTGIGLGLARSLIAAEQGSLHLLPPTTFVVSLPLLDQPV